jgi:glycosyltransferase involved in cell wall biosynthesis
MSENKRIDRLLNSIFNQTYKNFEVIVVDNFSKDKTKEVCKKYPITFIEERSTISKAWNIGLEHAKGKYILFIDSDMELPPLFLEECVKVIKSKSVDCIKFESTYVESKKASFINIVKPRNLERKLGGAPLNIYFYSANIIKNTRHPESENPMVGEEYIFRAHILKKNPKVGSVKTRVLHYYDPSLAWIVRRSWKYGKWFLETKKHLTTGEQLEFIRYNSVIKRESLSMFIELVQKKPRLLFPFLYYIFVKYVSFALGYLSNR